MQFIDLHRFKLIFRAKYQPKKHQNNASLIDLINSLKIHLKSKKFKKKLRQSWRHHFC